MLSLILAGLLGSASAAHAQSSLTEASRMAKDLLSSSQERRPAAKRPFREYKSTMRFSGYEWKIKDYPERIGPGPNFFSKNPQNVWVDDQGRLHLKITFRDGAWQSAEVFLADSLGHGTYRFRIDTDLSDLDPNAVLGLFTWDDDPAQNNREIDIEFSRWGEHSNANAQYTIQPSRFPEHTKRFEQTGVLHSHSMTWSPEAVSFKSLRDDGTTSQSWSIDSGIPDPGQEKIHMNLWLFKGRPPAEGHEVEIVISSFGFTPL